MMWACRECGTNISAEAEVCPRCGIRFKPPPVPPGPGSWGRSMEVAQGVFFGMLVWSIFAFIVGMMMAGWVLQQLGNAMQAHPAYP